MRAYSIPREQGMHALANSVALAIAITASSAGPAAAADKTALGLQIAEAMVDIARHGDLHDVAYTRKHLPLPFALGREFRPSPSATGAVIHYYELTLTRAQRRAMTMTYLVTSQGTLDPESSGTLTSYLYLSDLSDYGCVTAEILTHQFGPDERPENDGLSLVSLVVPLYHSDLSTVWLSYPRDVDRTGCFDHLGIAQHNR